MKLIINTLRLLSICILIASCNNDNFYNMDRFFTTDKESYKNNDSILLTINLVPKTEKTEKIRIYSNLKNIDIWTSFRRKCYPNRIEICSFSNQNNRTEKLESEIETYFITKQKPYRKTLKGFVTENESQFVIIFPEYGLESIIEKAELDTSIDFGFGGFCDPINPDFGASLEDYIKFKSISLCEKK